MTQSRVQLLNSNYVVRSINVCKTTLPEYSTMLFRLDFSSWATQDVSMFMETPRGCSCFDCIAMLLLCFFLSLRFILPFVSARQLLSSRLSHVSLTKDTPCTTLHLFSLSLSITRFIYYSRSRNYGLKHCSSILRSIVCSQNLEEERR